MTARKPLDERCNGSVNCPVEGHVRTFVRNGVTFSHVRLTRGQQETLWERYKARRAAAAVVAS